MRVNATDHQLMKSFRTRYAVSSAACPRALPAKRLGAAAVEFAMIAPLMLLFTFGLIELGRTTLVKDCATHATREGARVGIRPTATGQEVIDRVHQELALMSINQATVEIEPAALEAAPPGSYVTVRVRIPISTVSWIPGYFDFEAMDIVAQSSMRRESTH